MKKNLFLVLLCSYFATMDSCNPTITRIDGEGICIDGACCGDMPCCKLRKCHFCAPLSQNLVNLQSKKNCFQSYHEDSLRCSLIY